MVIALETYCPAKDGVSAARIEEEVVDHRRRAAGHHPLPVRRAVRGQRVLGATDDDRRAMAEAAVAGDGPDGSAMARAAGAARASRSSSTTARRDRAEALAERIGAAVAATPAEAASRADVRHHDGRRRRRRARPVRRSGGVPSRALRDGTVAVDMSTVTAGHHPGARGGRPGAGARASSTPRCRAASARTLAGELTIMVGGDAGRPRAGAARSLEPLAERDLPHGPARRGRGDEARGQHASSSGSTARSPEALVLAERAASTARSPTTCSPPAPSARRSSATSATRSSSPRRRRSRSRWRSPRRTCA